MAAAQGLIGLVAILFLCWGLSEARAEVPLRRFLRIAGTGLLLQFVLALILLKIPVVQMAFLTLNRLVEGLAQATEAGTSFVFGYLGGGPLPFESAQPGASFILAFRALPVVLVMSALSAVLFHWRILPLVVRAISWVLQRSMGIGGALGLGAAANIFVGMVEAPLFIRPYLARLSRGELFALMTVGMATIAGTMMVLYAAILGPVLPNALGHILVASVMSAPAALTVAMLMVPEPAGAHGVEADVEPIVPTTSGTMDAITRGTLDGVGLLINIVAMLLVLVALVALINQGLALLPEVAGAPLSMQRVLGWLFAPLAWAIGIPAGEAMTAGALLGTKTVLNEFIAYLALVGPEGAALSERSKIILIYALCGFANLGSLGIMIGGMSTLVPERRAEIVGLGFKSILAGTFATCMTGAVVGILS